MKLILNDGTEYEVNNGALPGTITMEIESYEEIQGLEESLSKSGNLDRVIIGEETIENLSLLSDMYFSVGRKNGKIEVIFMIREKTPQEIEVKTQIENIGKVVAYLTDYQALSVKELNKKWEDDPEGYSYSLSNPEDLRRLYAGVLWKLQKDHEKQSSLYPRSDSSAWSQIL